MGCLPGLEIAFRLIALIFSVPLAGRRQIHAGAPRFRQTNGDRLLRGADAVFALTDVVNFLADELAGLR